MVLLLFPVTTLGYVLSIIDPTDPIVSGILLFASTSCERLCLLSFYSIVAFVDAP